MSKQYEPQTPFNVAAKWLVPTKTKVNGVNQNSYADGETFFCSATNFNSSERMVNSLGATEDVWTFDAWYDSQITKNYRVRLLDDNTEWELVSTPENVKMRKQYMRFKAVRISG